MRPAFIVGVALMLTLPAFSQEPRKTRKLRLPNPLKTLKPLVWDLEMAGIWLAHAAHRREPFDEFTRPPEIVDPRPLREKARLFEQEIEKDFLRDSRRLFWSQIPNDLGDLAIWQGYYTAFRAHQYAVTKSTRALDYLSRAIQGHALLQAGYEKAYLVRGVDPEGGDAVRHPYFHEGRPYSWVDDASGSTLSGVVFGLHAAYQWGDGAVRAEAKRLIVKLADDLIGSNYRLRNSSGRSSRWGDHRANSWVVTPPRFLTAIALLNSAFAVSGEERFALEKSRYLDNAVVKKIAASGEIHFVWFAREFNQHLAFMNYYVLLATETDPLWQAYWLEHLSRLMEKFRREGNSFFTYIYGTFFSVNANLRALALQSLREFRYPKRWEEVLNSQEPSIEKVGKWSLQPLPVWRRVNTDVVWQRSPYQLDGPPGNRYSGIDFLLAYWMGRHLKMIGSQQ